MAMNGGDEYETTTKLWVSVVSTLANPDSCQHT
jgi:hypothetical protein